MENKTSKYLKYAIGEIVLVMIGILLALQVSNWNNNRQNKTLEKLSLVSLKNDLILQAKIIKTQINEEEAYVDKVDSCLMMIKSKIEIGIMVTLLDSLSERLTFVSNRVAFDNIGSNGKTIIITNPDLNNEIVKYYQHLEYTESVINNNNLYRVNSQFGAYVLNNDLGIQINSEGQPFLAENIGAAKKFRLVKHLEGRRYSAENNREKCIIQLDNTMSLIDLINKELNND